jgi:hypothetical protein
MPKVKHNGFIPHLNSNRLLGFYGNLCGSIAAFLIIQAEKYGDWYEMEVDE